MGEALPTQRIPGDLRKQAAEQGWENRACLGSRRSNILPLAIPVVFILVLTGTAAAQNCPNDPSSKLTPDVEARLKNQLTDNSTDTRRSALFELRDIGSETASRIALPALADKDELVRATAAMSVICLPPTQASASLMPLLDDKAEFVRREAAFALGYVRDASSVARLIRLMRSDKILEVKTAAAIAIGKIGDRSATDSLVAVLKTRPREDDEFLRRSAARSIGQIAIGQPEALTPQNFLPEKYKDTATGDISSLQFFSNAVDVLIGVLRDINESDDTRREAAFALGAIGDKKAVSALQAHISSSDPYLAEICREALAKIEKRNRTAS